MHRLTTQEIIDQILLADKSEILDILDSARERFSELFPDQELLVLAVPGSDPDSQITELHKAASLLSGIK
jgi:hypothetical protein